MSQPPRAFVLLLDSDPTSRRHLASGLTHAGIDVVAAPNAVEALVTLARRPSRPSAIVVDPAVRDIERISLTGTTVVVLGEQAAPVVRHARVVVPRHIAPADLVAILGALQRGEPPPRPARFPTGTGGLPASDLTLERRPEDLHAFAATKLGQYFGVRGAGLLDALVREAGLDRIRSTSDLRAVATRLALRGQVESAVASLLSGRATLIDSDGTLRSTRS